MLTSMEKSKGQVKATNLWLVTLMFAFLICEMTLKQARNVIKGMFLKLMKTSLLFLSDPSC